uniref:Cilia- and flagella-associated protein 52 n=1 Tax=Sinocyclocheilus grahami TaxID=75366 RepID=A0A672QL79_SINGR
GQSLDRSFFCVDQRFLNSVQLEGGVTSVTLRGDRQQFYVGTEAAQIYNLGYTDFKPELIATNHNTWNDGKIRVFTPESGKLSLIIHNAHSMGVTAIAATNDCKRFVRRRTVRVWEIFQNTYRLIEIMKEHKATVNCIKIKSNDKECVTASSDGACIIWDLVRFVRNQMVLSNTLFSAVCYHPEEFQIITSGTDRKIGYWEVYDGSAIRELEGSLFGAINGMSISEDGKYFVTGGDDKLLKLWHYSDGEVTHVGIGHSGSITNVRICHNSRYIVSTSADGAILRWRYPQTS